MTKGGSERRGCSWPAQIIIALGVSALAVAIEVIFQVLGPGTQVFLIFPEEIPLGAAIFFITLAGEEMSRKFLFEGGLRRLITFGK